MKDVLLCRYVAFREFKGRASRSAHRWISAHAAQGMRWDTGCLSAGRLAAARGSMGWVTVQPAGF